MRGTRAAQTGRHPPWERGGAGGEEVEGDVESGVLREREVRGGVEASDPAICIAIGEDGRVDHGLEHGEALGVDPAAVHPRGSSAGGAAGAALVDLVHVRPAGGEGAVGGAAQLFEPGEGVGVEVREEGFWARL